MRSVITKLTPGTINISGFVLRHGPNFVDTAAWLRAISEGPHAERLRGMLGSELRMRHRASEISGGTSPIPIAPPPMIVPEFTEVFFDLPITGEKIAVNEPLTPTELIKEPVEIVHPEATEDKPPIEKPKEEPPEPPKEETEKPNKKPKKIRRKK